MLILFAIFKNPDSCLTSGTALRTKYYYSTQESSTENLPKAIAWGSGSIWFVQLCHRRFQQDTNIMWQSRTHRLVCLFRLPLFCFFFSKRPACVAEREQTCRGSTVLMLHSACFLEDWRSRRHTQSIPEAVSDRPDHRPAGNNRPADTVPLLLLTFLQTIVAHLVINTGVLFWLALRLQVTGQRLIDKWFGPDNGGKS